MTSHEQRHRLGPVIVSRTAQFYGPGVANELIRAALHPYPEGLALVSKVGARRDLSGRVLRFDSPAQLTQGIEDTVRVLPLQGRPGRRRWETRVYHWRAAEKAHGHHPYRWGQRGGHLVLRRRGGCGCLWLRLGDKGRGFAGEFFEPLP
jgi:hypothetical protein